MIELDRSHRVLDAIGALLARLRDVQDSHALERRFCRDAAGACEFTRVMLSRVEGDEWRPWAVSFAIDPEFDRHFSTHLRGIRIPFAESPAERRSVRDRAPVVLDPDREPGVTPLPLVGLTSSYVVVPLVGSGGVFGLVHADHHRGTGAPQRLLDASDRDTLWLLADGFARLYERAVLVERLQAQQSRLRRALSQVEADVARIVDADPGLIREHRLQHFDHPPAAVQRVTATLTPRERDVADLVAKGFTNAAISRELVIVEGTVKTHVKNLMRKLGAATRPEAIAVLLGHPTRN
jgi:DNA-binding CsgD family transcriptional regulator